MQKFYKADDWVLHKLAEQMRCSGYSEYYASFNPLIPRKAQWINNRNNIPERLRSIIDLFLLSCPVEIEAITPVLGKLVEPLCNIGVLYRTKNDLIATPGLILVPILGRWLFCQKPQLNPTLYFGDDSIALLLRLRPKVGDNCLDLCAGPGIQSLYCSLFSPNVLAVELNPVAAALANLNAVMNDCNDRMTVYCGNLYEPVRDKIFDTIVANPPLLPFPDDASYPFVGHGGSDGLQVTWRILSGLPIFLANNGTAQLIGATLSDGILPLCTDALDVWGHDVGMDLLMTVTSHQLLEPGTPYFDGLVSSVELSRKHANKQTLVTAYQKSLACQGATHLCAYFLHITRGKGGLEIQDLSRDEALGLWYV